MDVCLLLVVNLFQLCGDGEDVILDPIAQWLKIMNPFPDKFILILSIFVYLHLVYRDLFTVYERCLTPISFQFFLSEIRKLLQRIQQKLTCHLNMDVCKKTMFYLQAAQW